MNVSETKLRLIGRITNSADEELLAEVERLLNTGSESTSYSFTSQEQTEISKVEEEISVGKYITHQQAKDEANKWLED
jgi:hypothetical protein